MEGRGRKVRVGGRREEVEGKVLVSFRDPELITDAHSVRDLHRQHGRTTQSFASLSASHRCRCGAACE